MKPEAYNQLDQHSIEQMKWVHLNTRIKLLESSSDMADENYKTLQAENEDLKDIVEGLKDRTIDNRNDMADITIQLEEMKEDIKWLKPKSFWKTYF